MKKLSVLLLFVAFSFASVAGDGEPINNDKHSVLLTQISFAGMQWWVFNKIGSEIDSINYYSQDNVWVDENGRLHLTISYSNGHWRCAKVFSVANSDYGEHHFSMINKNYTLPDNIVFGTYLYVKQDEYNDPPMLKEIDIEFSRWSDPNYPNTGYAIHYDDDFTNTSPEWPLAADNVPPFETALNGDDFFQSNIGWRSDEIEFTVTRSKLKPKQSSTIGNNKTSGGGTTIWSPTAIINNTIFNDDMPSWDPDYIPDPAVDQMRVHISYWLNNATPPSSNTNEVYEIIIRDVDCPINAGGKNSTENNELAKNTSNSSFKSTQASSISKTRLGDNQPNPFNNQTNIPLSIKEDALSAQLYIYDMYGKEVKMINIQERNSTVLNINCADLPDGIYLYSLLVDGKKVDSKKMVIKK